MDKREWNKSMAEFREVIGDGKVAVIIIQPRDGFDALMAAAISGNREARLIMEAFTQWSEHADRALCFSCNAPIVNLKQGGEGIGAFALLYVDGGDHQLSAVCCPKCLGLGRDEIHRRFVCAAEDDTYLASSPLQ